MKVQVQEHGSYRSEDMVKALDWMLPDASDSNESIIVLLDWYSGHLTEEVAEMRESALKESDKLLVDSPVKAGHVFSFQSPIKP